MAKTYRQAQLDIALMLPTITREIEAFADTGMPHDRARVDKAIGYLKQMIAELEQAVAAMPIVNEDTP